MRGRSPCTFVNYCRVERCSQRHVHLAYSTRTHLSHSVLLPQPMLRSASSTPPAAGSPTSLLTASAITSPSTCHSATASWPLSSIPDAYTLFQYADDEKSCMYNLPITGWGRRRYGWASKEVMWFRPPLADLVKTLPAAGAARNPANRGFNSTLGSAAKIAIPPRMLKLQPLERPRCARAN